MKVEALLLGAVAVFASAAARADPLPLTEPAEQYVRICDAFGAGFFYIPATDTCLRLSGYVRAEYHYVDGDIADFDPQERFDKVTSRARANVRFDARTSSNIGLIRTYIEFETQRGPGDGFTDANTTDKYSQNFGLRAAFIEIAGDWGTFTAGRTGSFFDFFGSDDFGTRIDIDDSTTEQTLFAYTFKGAQGLSATLSIEDPNSGGRRLDGTDDYEGQTLPDLVGNIRLEGEWGSAQVMAVGRRIDDEDGDGLGWAASAGLSLNLPVDGITIATQFGYADGALAYITTDPGGIGDFFVPDGSETNQAWMARGGLVVPVGGVFSTWIDGSFTRVERVDDAAYEFWALVIGAAWKPSDSISMGPEFGYNDIVVDGAPDDFENWGVMWRVQADF